MREPIRWETEIPLVTNRFMLWDFAKVAVLSPAIMFVTVALMAWIVEEELLILPWPLFIVTALAMLVLFVVASLILGNRHRATFEVGEDGVVYEAGAREKRINAGVTALGALAGSASAAGAGLIAQSRQHEGYEWSVIHRMRVHPDARVVALMSSWRVLVRLYVPEHLWEQVVAVCGERIAQAQAAREAAAASERRRAWWSRVAWSLLGVVLGVCTQAWYWVDYDYEALARVGLLGGLVTALAAAVDGPARRLLGALGGLMLLGHVWALGASAAEPFESMFGGTVLTATFDPATLALAAASTLALLAIAAWRTFGSRRP